MVAPAVAAGLMTMGPQIVDKGFDILSNIPVIGGLFESDEDKAAKAHQQQMAQVAAMYQRMAPAMYSARMQGANQAAAAFDPVNNMLAQKYGPGATSDVRAMVAPTLSQREMNYIQTGSFDGGQPQQQQHPAFSNMTGGSNPQANQGTGVHPISTQYSYNGGQPVTSTSRRNWW